MANKKEDINVREEYGDSCIRNSKEFLTQYHISLEGLDSQKALDLQHQYGPNEIRQAKPKKWYHYFFSSLFSPFNMILLGISFVLIYTDIILPEIPSPANIIVITVLILVSTYWNFLKNIDPIRLQRN